MLNLHSKEYIEQNIYINNKNQGGSMEKIYSVRHEEIFKYFYEICSIPHGSGDMGKIT